MIGLSGAPLGCVVKTSVGYPAQNPLFVIRSGVGWTMKTDCSASSGRAPKMEGGGSSARAGASVKKSCQKGAFVPNSRRARERFLTPPRASQLSQARLMLQPTRVIADG